MWTNWSASRLAPRASSMGGRAQVLLASLPVEDVVGRVIGGVGKLEQEEHRREAVVARLRDRVHVLGTVTVARKPGDEHRKGALGGARRAG